MEVTTTTSLSFFCEFCVLLVEINFCKTGLGVKMAGHKQMFLFVKRVWLSISRLFNVVSDVIDVTLPHKEFRNSLRQVPDSTLSQFLQM